MNTSNPDPIPISEVCEQVRSLGFAVSESVRLYGEEFQVVSDPFPQADGIAVQVKTKKDSNVRILQLPATIVQGVKRRKRAA